VYLHNPLRGYDNKPTGEMYITPVGKRGDILGFPQRNQRDSYSQLPIIRLIGHVSPFMLVAAGAWL